MSSALETFRKISDWAVQRELHQKRVHPWIERHRQRRSHSKKHPVYDFLFDYYSFRPSLLERWTPGAGTLLLGATPNDFPHFKELKSHSGGLILDRADFPEKRRETLEWVIRFLEKIESRPAHFACFGLHEWAMVYRDPNLRHTEPLRMAPEALAAFVESLPIACSHFDAFRFFTHAARPLNRLQPERDTRIDLEQPGCIHVTMDLYKWTYKFWPWTSSDLLAETFSLALKAREIDMRASPYDLLSYGFHPIAIETTEGRAEYEKEQRELSLLAAPIRKRLLTELRELNSAKDLSAD